MKKIKVGVLGATGMVGQRFIQLLDNHPFFEVSEVAASRRSAGEKYSEAIAGRWKLETPIPEKIADMVVRGCAPCEDFDCKIVFSALDAEIAAAIEKSFAKEGYAVCSNSRCHRMEPDVPLVVPEVNYNHLEILREQQKRRGFKGFIVTNPNCSTIGLVLLLAPLHKTFNVKKVFVTTLQALSGAGYPGVASLDILDNVIPFIGGEEGKMETETLKILGELKNNKFKYADIKVSAHCNRVAVKDGHTECVSLELEKNVNREELIQCLRDFNPLKKFNLPSAPDPPIILKGQDDRPQPKLDRDLGRSMAVSVGRIRKCNILDWKLVLLTHNTIRGAAGASILNAEILKAKGLV